MPIKEQLKKLIALQAIDAEIYHLQQREETEIPERLKQCDEELSEYKKQTLQMEEKLKVLQLEKKNKELDLQTKESNVKKLQLQLYQIKTNKEYTALEKEIERYKADNSLLEEAIIHLLDELDDTSEHLNQEKKKSEEGSKRIFQEKEKAKQELEEVKQRTRDLQALRKSMVPQIEAGILPRYERVLKLRHGMAVVSVRNGACQGCFLNLTPQDINLIYAAEDWVVCNQCSRILYVEETQNAL